MINLNEVIAKYGNQEVDESKIKEVLGIKDSKVWKPKFGETYYYFTDSGVGVTNGCVEESSRFRIGNFYKTLEEAEFARDKQIFLTKFERYLRENEDEPVDWSKYSQQKYVLAIDYIASKISIWNYNFEIPQGLIVTTSHQTLLGFLRDNEADIKKYMFGVK